MRSAGNGDGLHFIVGYVCVYCIPAVFVSICLTFKNINLEKIILVLKKVENYLLVRSFLKLLFVPSQRIESS